MKSTKKTPKSSVPCVPVTQQGFESRPLPCPGPVPLTFPTVKSVLESCPQQQGRDGDTMRTLPGDTTKPRQDKRDIRDTTFQGAFTKDEKHRFLHLGDAVEIGYGSGGSKNHTLSSNLNEQLKSGDRCLYVGSNSGFKRIAGGRLLQVESVAGDFAAVTACGWVVSHQKPLSELRLKPVT